MKDERNIKNRSKKAVSLLFRPDTLELILKYYKLDCPYKEHSLSEWVDDKLKMALQERELLE